MSHPYEHHQLKQVAQPGLVDARFSPASSTDPEHRLQSMSSLVPGSIVIMLAILICETLVGTLVIYCIGPTRSPAIVWYESVAGVWMVGLPSLIAAWWGIRQIRSDALKTLVVIFGNMAVHFGALVIGCFIVILLTGFDATTVLLSGLAAFAVCLIISTAAFRNALLEAPQPKPLPGSSRNSDRDRRAGVETPTPAGDDGPDQILSSDHKNVGCTEVTL